MSHIFSRLFVLLLSYLVLPIFELAILFAMAQNAHAADVASGAVPATAAHSSCDDKGLVDQVMQKFFSTYCMGPLVEPKLLKSAGAKTVYDLVESEVFDQGLAADRNTKHMLVTDKVIRPYLQKNQKYLHQIVNPSLRFYFGEPSGIDGLTVGQHTVRVLNIYVKQKEKFNVSQMPRPEGVRNLDALIGYTLAFHDVGRSIAFKSGLFERMSSISLPFTRTLLTVQVANPDDKSGLSSVPFFNDREVSLALGLMVEQQTLTQYMNNEISLATAQARIVDRTKIMNFDARAYFQMLKIFNVADAASSPSLGAALYTRDHSGKIVFRNQKKFDALARLF